MLPSHSKTHLSPAKIALRNFSSQWFLIPQGSGILAITLHQLDYQFRGLLTISIIVWVFTIALLALMLALYVLRLAIFPSEVKAALSSDTNETACMASISITFTCTVQMVALVCVTDWGPGWGIVAFVLWWVAVGMALLASIGIPYVFAKHEPPGLPGFSPSTQLPLIAALTAAAGGGVVCSYGDLNDKLKVPVVTVSYLLVGIALPLALGFDTVFLTRLFDGSSPSKTRTFTEMVLCGPWGQGSFALQILGKVVLSGTFAGYNAGTFLVSEAQKPVGYVSMLGGLIAWGQGTFWWSFALLSIFHSALDTKPPGQRGIAFGLPAWAVVFPWGVYTNAAVELGKILDSAAFVIWSTVLAVILVIIWLLNIGLTVRGIANGKLLGLDHGWRGHYGGDVTNNGPSHESQNGAAVNGRSREPRSGSAADDNPREYPLRDMREEGASSS